MKKKGQLELTHSNVILNPLPQNHINKQIDKSSACVPQSAKCPNRKLSLGDFKLVRTLGEGKFGTVYAALHI